MFSAVFSSFFGIFRSPCKNKTKQNKLTPVFYLFYRTCFTVLPVLHDIDIAHRVSFRDTSRVGPKPIVCKFIRRLARNEVMSKRKEGRSVDPSTIGLHEGTDMSNVLLLDHLTPRLQQLYSDAKEFKLKYGYQFCWARNGSIFLRYSADEGSKLLKVRTSGDLARYAQDEQGQLS